MTTRHKIGIITAAIIAASCTSQQLAPIKTVAQVAEVACSAFFAREQKMSVEDALNAFCATEEQLRPFMQSIRAAEGRAMLREMQRAEVLDGH